MGCIDARMTYTKTANGVKIDFYLAGVLHLTIFSFPLDMLRYDQCFPLSESEIERMTARYAPGNTPALVRVGRYSSHAKDAGWTHARWESFGWTIEE